MEFSTCLDSPSTTNLDPTFNQNATQLTFASCSGTSVPVGGPFAKGATSTTCIGASLACSAVSAGYQAEDYFGSHVFTIPIWSGRDTQGSLSNWAGVTYSQPAFNTAFGGGYSASATYFANTVADLRLSLNRSDHWQDGGPVTAWDVKYSYMNLNATGAFQATSLSNVARINVIDEFTLDLNLKAKGPFTELFIGGITIIPGHIWSACGASTWNNGVTGKNIAGTSIANAAEDTCVGHFGAPSITSVGGVRADSPTFDPMANNFLIGSGPYTCESIGGTGHPPAGTIGAGCSIDNTQYPP